MILAADDAMKYRALLTALRARHDAFLVTYREAQVIEAHIGHEVDWCDIPSNDAYSRAMNKAAKLIREVEAEAERREGL